LTQRFEVARVKSPLLYHSAERGKSAKTLNRAIIKSDF
jgi:hypothetical protein